MSNERVRPSPTGPDFPPGAVPGATPASDEIDLRAYWAVLMRQRLFIAIVTVLCGGIAAAASFLITPMYEAHALLMPVSNKVQDQPASSLVGRLGGVASMVGISLGEGEVDRKVVALAILKSRQFTEEFIRDENLLPVLFPNLQEVQDKLRAGRGAPGGNAEADDTLQRELMWMAYRKFSALRRIDIDRKTGLLGLSIRWTDRHKTVEWLNKLVQRINDRMRRDDTEEANRNLEFLYKQYADSTITEVRQSIVLLIEQEIKRMMLAKGMKDYVFRVVDPPVLPTPQEKVNLAKRVVAGLGLLIGLFVGILLAFVRQGRRERAMRAEAAASA